MNRCALVVMLLAPMMAVAQQQDRLVIEADVGASPVSSSQSLSYAQGTIEIDELAAGLNARSPAGAATSWRLTVEPPEGRTLLVGCYERGQRFAVQGRPAIDFAFGGSACNQSYGRFRVLDIQRDGTNSITSLAVDFAQQCDRYGKAVSGKIRFNSTIPTSGAPFPAVTNPTGSLLFVAEPGAVGGAAPGGTASFELSRQNSHNSINADNGFSFRYDSGVIWNVDFAAPADAVIVSGSYANATRFPFQLPGEAGLEFSYNTAACATLIGSFNVSEAMVDGLDNIPLRYVAAFTQQCNSATDPVTSGWLTFNANLIGPSAQPSLDFVFADGFEVEGASMPSYYNPNCG